MTLLLGDTGKSQIGSLKTFTITPPTAKETLLTGGSILTLPTTEPGTSQVIYTVQASDLPTISPNVPMKYNAALVCSGKVGAAASVINYRVLKNSVSVAQAAGASALATQFWTHTHWRTFDVQVGDVLEVKYWAAQADVTLDFYGMHIIPSQPDVSKRGTILKDLYLSTSTDPTFVVSTLGVATLQYYLSPFTAAGGTTNDITPGTANDYTFLCICLNPTYGLFRIAGGERNTASTNQGVNATARQVQKQIYPKIISFREVLR
jgi:hypothetical protein